MKTLKQINEGRPSQRHALEGHPYHKKSDDELRGIMKDANEAKKLAREMGNEKNENKYADQVNDASTVMHFRKNGMPNWYKKKYGHMKEEVELTEGKMGELHADLQDTLDKHINDYKSKKLGHDQFGDKVVAAHGAIAKRHNISHGSAQKFVNDYVDHALKEEVDESVAYKHETGQHISKSDWKRRSENQHAQNVAFYASQPNKTFAISHPDVDSGKEKHFTAKYEDHAKNSYMMHHKNANTPGFSYNMKTFNGLKTRTVNEGYELTEGNDEVGEMIKDKLKIILNRAQELHDGIGPNTDMPEWVKSKITLAQDYISTACDYSCGKEQLGEQHREKGRFHPTVPHNVPNVKTPKARHSGVELNVPVQSEAKEEMDSSCSKVRDLAKKAVEKQKTIKESIVESRKAQIVKGLVKKKKTDEFNSEPEIHNSLIRTTTLQT